MVDTGTMKKIHGQTMNKFEIDQEAANRITLLNLKDWRKYLVKENRDLKKKFPLPDHLAQDMTNNIKYIQALDIVIGAYEVPPR
jgi:hypothetical protein